MVFWRGQRSQDKLPPAERPPAAAPPSAAERQVRRRWTRAVGASLLWHAVFLPLALPRLMTPAEQDIEVAYLPDVVESDSASDDSQQPEKELPAEPDEATLRAFMAENAAQYADLLDMYKKSRAEGFGPEVKRRIMIGTYVLSHGYYDAYYLQAQKIRRMIADDFQNAFKECDVIAGPVAPTVAWKLGDHGNDPLADYLADIFTLPGSLAGLPGMSVPAGFGEGGMPVGLQLLGNYFQEARLLNAAHRLQQATDWHMQTPEGF